MSVRTLIPVVIFAVASLLAACGGGDTNTRSQLQQARLPETQSIPFPQDSGEPLTRSGSVQGFIDIQADKWFSAAPGVVAQDSDALLDPPEGELHWAVYRMEGIGSDFYPIWAGWYQEEVTGGCWLAYANYATGRWEIRGNKSFANGHLSDYEEKWPDYVSPGGNLYIAVINDGGGVAVDHVRFNIDNNKPPQPPVNLTASPGELSAMLQWDELTDSRVTELRVYHSLDSQMEGASLLGTVGAAETQAIYNNLDHNLTHYFTVRSYIFALDLESADSNIASCQPNGPVSETFLPPVNLQATAIPGGAELSWDAYSDPRASHIRIYSSPNSDMTAATMEEELDAAETGYTLRGLTAQETYYFALTAWWEAAQLESEPGNIASCTPLESPLELMDGQWPRFGGNSGSDGYSALLGPEVLTTSRKVAIGDDRLAECGVSPVIDADGRVYALSRDAQLHCFSADLETTHWSTDLNSALDDIIGADALRAAPQAPLLDSLGNIYCAVVEHGESRGGNGWLMSCDADGNVNWKLSLGELPVEPVSPYPSLNIGAGGELLAYGDNQSVLYGVDQDGNVQWDNSATANANRLFLADIALSSTGSMGMPTWLEEIWLDPRPHWLGIDSADGSQQQEYEAFGDAKHAFGGIFMPNGFFYFPTGNRLQAIDPADASEHDNYEVLVNLSGAPARDASGQLMFFSEDQGGGFSGFAAFHCLGFNDDFPPTMAPVYSVSLEAVTVLAKPAIDAENTAYFTDTDGTIHMVVYDSREPPGPQNPQHLSRDLRTSFSYSSVAIGDGAVYVISEGNELFMIGTPGGRDGDR